MPVHLFFFSLVLLHVVRRPFLGCSLGECFCVPHTIFQLAGVASAGVLFSQGLERAGMNCPLWREYYFAHRRPIFDSRIAYCQESGALWPLPSQRQAQSEEPLSVFDNEPFHFLGCNYLALCLSCSVKDIEFSLPSANLSLSDGFHRFF